MERTAPLVDSSCPDEKTSAILWTSPPILARLEPMRGLVFTFGALLLLIASAACNDKTVKCTGWAGSDGQLLSVGSLTSCTDNKPRDVRCARNSPDAQFKCSCIEGGTPGKSFERATALPANATDLTKLTVEQCGWTLK
jgi:hypothetical protein